MVRGRRRTIVAIASLLVGIMCAAHIWDARYFFRILPLTLWAYEMTSDAFGEKIFTPPPAKSFTHKLPLFKFDTSLGREQALTYVRGLVPLSGPAMTYSDLTPEKWFARLKTRRGYFTDFSLLLISLADRAGLQAREWILWHDDNWSHGSAHSMVEIRLPNGLWVAMDGQHATILISKNQPISMSQVFKLASKSQTIGTKRLPIAEKIGLPKAASTKSALHHLPSGAMLNLHLASWTGAKHRPIIAIPIIYGDLKIDWRIWSKKFAFLFAILAFVAFILAIRKRKSEI